MSTATHKLGSCPPHVAAHLRRHFPNGVRMAAGVAPGTQVEFDLVELLDATLRALVDDPAVSKPLRDDAAAELEERGAGSNEDDAPEVEASRTKRRKRPGPSFDESLSLSHAAADFDFEKFCEA